MCVCSQVSLFALCSVLAAGGNSVKLGPIEFTLKGNLGMLF